MNLKKLQGTIEKIGKDMPPEDDWMPALIVEGKKEITIYGFVGRPMDGDRNKDLVARQITECIAQFKPDCACFITTAWSIDFEKEGVSKRAIEDYMSGALRVSNHPNRVEIVNAYVYGVRGKSKGEALMIGYIQRHPDKGPTIKEWKVIKEGVSAEGRFPEAVKKGFQLAKGV